MKNKSDETNKGLVVPVDLQALCIGTDPGAEFNQAPYNFEKLKSPPYLSETAELVGKTNMERGVHLHWALPDAINHGVQKGDGTVFHSIPDRWLITRVISNEKSGSAPTFERWILESNYTDTSDPNVKSGRKSVTSPYNPYNDEGTLGTPWRYLGRVQPLNDWMEGETSFGAVPGDNFAPNLTTVGYGTADFAAFYQNSMSVLGFNDLAGDLLEMAENDEVSLSYHVIGWYGSPENDPVRQLPEVLNSDLHDKLLAALTDATQKAFFVDHYVLADYNLKDDLDSDIDNRLTNILLSVGYPVILEAPQLIAAADFEQLLKKIKLDSDRKLVEDSYSPQYVLTDIDSANHAEMWQVMKSAGYNFLGSCLAANDWSLPASAEEPSGCPEYSLYSGFISNISWNSDKDYFETLGKEGNYNVAIGNTQEEALSALVANSGSFEDPELVEDVLNALQTGLLDDLKDESMLKDWEKLKYTLFQNSFNSTAAGFLWEVHDQKNDPEDLGETTLPDDLASALNNLNVAQQDANELEEKIRLERQQIFEDWYKFMLVYHRKHDGMNPGEIAEYLTKKVDELKGDEDLLSQAQGAIEDEYNALAKALPEGLIMNRITAPRYWQPNDPVVLVQGDGVNVSDRYGNDGRFMYNDTLLCRTVDQLHSQLKVPANAFGNSAELTIDKTSFPALPTKDEQPIISAVNAGSVDGFLSDANTLAQILLKMGSSETFADLRSKLIDKIRAYLSPDIQTTLTAGQYQNVLAVCDKENSKFLESMYKEGTSGYELTTSVDKLTDDQKLRLKYLYLSAPLELTPDLKYDGHAMSQVGMEIWEHNVWLPFSFKWRVHFFPFQQVSTASGGYPVDIVTSNFEVGETTLDYTGPEKTLSQSGINPYLGNIFLTPHANINLKYQIDAFITNHPDSPFVDDLTNIRNKLSALPILSQALSGFNEALLMLKEDMQLEVADPDAERNYYRLTRDVIHPAVADQNSVKPQMDNDFNPIRIGLAQLKELDLVDIFGWNIPLSVDKISRAQSMIQSVMRPAGDIYLNPRITQPARLFFRWLSAADDKIEMNSHPATTPICGWVLANHLDSSLWVYDNAGDPYGSFIINEEGNRIIWQCTPGSPYFGLTFTEFMTVLGSHVNAHFKGFLTDLYGDGGAASAAYLGDFITALDTASTTIDPANNAQYRSNAVLMGRPYALTRAMLRLDLQGRPLYSQSWSDFETVVDDYYNHDKYSPGTDLGYTDVRFPVKIGHMAHSEDGMVGYFKGNNYKEFFAPASHDGGHGVKPPPPDNITLSFHAETDPQYVSMILEPRGVVHAFSGILPVKELTIPPDQYLDALLKLNLCFLTSPILTNTSRLSLPIPGTAGGEWSWVENQGGNWTQKQTIQTVTPNATMNYQPQCIVEGWLNLANRILNGKNFKLVNKATDKPELFKDAPASDNVMSFSIVNTFAQDLKLIGGDPVDAPYQDKGSTFLLSFGALLTDAVSSALGIKADSGNWKFVYFPGDNGEPGSWGMAPVADMVIKPKEQVTFTVSNITVDKKASAANAAIRFYGLPDLPYSIAPATKFIEVSPKP